MVLKLSKMKHAKRLAQNFVNKLVLKAVQYGNGVITGKIRETICILYINIINQVHLILTFFKLITVN